MIYRTLMFIIGIVVATVLILVVFWNFKYYDVVDEDGERPRFWRRGAVGRKKLKEERDLEKL